METRRAKRVLESLRGSQPTYKEWKLEKELARDGEVVHVPSLPTRNGNTFVSWICSYMGHLVPSLPTRNGNWPGNVQEVQAAEEFPAYLQGMETDVPENGNVAVMGFPAYLQGMETGLRGNTSPARSRCSQPTYKEWKQNLDGFKDVLEHRSQPTYKEWKLVKSCASPRRILVPSLPTRNGNQSAHRKIAGPGRFPAYLQGMETLVKCENLLTPCVKFPAYLQGMETGLRFRLRLRGPRSSQPTYKEWKPIGGIVEDYIPEDVPSLPTRNGNLV